MDTDLPPDGRELGGWTRMGMGRVMEFKIKSAKFKIVDWGGNGRVHNKVTKQPRGTRKFVDEGMVGTDSTRSQTSPGNVRDAGGTRPSRAIKDSR